MPKLSQPITKKKLVALRNALLQLHQKLLDYQRRTYEKSHGRVQSTGKMFTLASQDKDFAWLRSLSELIVGLDGYIDKAEYDSKNVASLLKYTTKVLTPKQGRTKFERLYFEALQTDPTVLIAHRQVTVLLHQKKSASKKSTNKRKAV